jgi:hypothetical protein
MSKKNQTDLRQETHTSWEQKNDKKNLPGQRNEKQIGQSGREKTGQRKKISLSSEHLLLRRAE